MEEGMDPRRGPPLVGGTRWASGDMYHLGSSSSSSSGNSSGDGGTGNNNMNTRIRFEESGESSSRAQGPESSRPPVRKSSQLSPKLVVARSSGGRRVQRPHHQGSHPGPWNVLHGFVDGLHEAGVAAESMGGVEGDGSLGMGLSTHLGLSEEIIVHPAHVHSLSSSEFLGRTGRPRTTTTLDFLSGRSSMQANSMPDYFGGSGTAAAGQEGEHMNGRMGALTGGRVDLEERAVDASGNMAFSSLFMDHEDLPDGGRSGMDERPSESGAGGMMFDSLFMDRHDDAQLQASNNNSNNNSNNHNNNNNNNNNNSFMGAAEAFLPSGGSRGFDESAYRHSLFSSAGGASPESSSGSHGHVGSSSSRSSACKRKSCAPVVPGNMSFRSGSPHRTGYRDAYSGRSGSGSGLGSRRSTTGGIGGSASAPEALGSSSSPSDTVFLGLYAEPPAVAYGLEEPVSRRTNFGREAAEVSPESLREGRYGKSVAGGSSSSAIANSQRTTRAGANGIVLSNSGANHSPLFPRTVRRAMPLHDNLPRRTPVPDSSMDTDVGLSSSSSSSSSLLEQMMSANQARRSESPLLAGERVGAWGSGRRSEAAFGTSGSEDRVMHRYMGNNNSTRGLSSSGSSASHLGGAAALESRLRSRVLSQQSEHMSQSSPPPMSQPMSLAMQASVAAGAAPSSTPYPSRPPPHPPSSLRGRLQGSSLQALLPPPLPSPLSGPAPSRLPPSPPSRLPPSLNPLSFAPSIDSLPSPTTLFRGSLLHGSSPAGLRDRGFMSAAESLLGMPFRGLQMPSGNGGSQPRLVAEGVAEILLALERVERNEDLTYEQLLILEATLLFGGMGLHDQHSDLRLDVDNMSYEELLALEERIGNVSTGLTSDAIEQKLKKTRYSSLDAVVAQYSQECDIKCSICQEEYEEGDELGKIECGHGYHAQCIQQWLVQKNQCPICKAAAFS